MLTNAARGRDETWVNHSTYKKGTEAERKPERTSRAAWTPNHPKSSFGGGSVWGVPRLRVNEIRPHTSSLTQLLPILSRERDEASEGRRVVVDALVVGHAVDVVKDGGMEGGAEGEG
jgi:hypothetical protein